MQKQPGCRLPHDHVVFYGACVAAALEHLHERHYVYRDVKPENLLLDAKGYLRLVDLGFAKECLSKTFTLCGTPEYLAPEVILNLGHAQPADCWSLGVLLYECLVGRAPFYSERGDQMELYQKIIKAKLPEAKELPADAPKLDKKAKAVIDELVVKKPEDRLSCSAREKTGAMRHAFFGLVDWGKLQQRGMAAPFVPTIADAFDSRLYEVAGEPPPEEGEFDREAAAEAFKEWSSSGKDDDGTMQMLQAKGVAGKLWTGVRRRMSLN